MTKQVYNPQRLIAFFGWPGVGKTTLAHSLLDRIAACILNKDSIAMPMTQDVEGELYKKVVGPGSYGALWNLSRDNLSHGQSVVLESPFHNLLRGEVDANLEKISRETASPLKLICCVAPNELVRDRMIRRGEPRDAPKLDNWDAYVAKTHIYKVTVPHLKIDTSIPMNESVQSILDYLNSN